MKAIQFHEFGEPGVLRYGDVDMPSPSSGQVLIRVAATSFNSVDGNIRAGFMQGPIPIVLPHIPGLDVAGVVESLGDAVTGLSVGDEVVGFLPMSEDGASADYVLAPAAVLAAAPSTIPLADAAALPLVGLTAWQALFDHAQLVAGQRVLINGASGAVGGYAVQLAKAAGASVIATASPQTIERVAGAGADEIIDYTSTTILEAVTEPVDIVVNLAPIDPTEFAALVALVRSGGVVVSTTVWMPTPADEKRNVRAVDLYVRSDRDQLTELVARVDRGELVVDVAEHVPLADLASVHARAMAGTISGKVVIDVAPS